jgi:hypothetical protein
MDNLARPDSELAFGEGLLRLVETDGSAGVTAPLQKFMNDSREVRDLRSSVKIIRPALIADIAHFMCISHGRLPGVVDHAASKIVDEAARIWLVQAIDGFAAERSFLNQLTVAAGPIRRLVGQDKISALLANQSKSFEMLATSDRNGCPAGAAIAFVLDWQATRKVLELASMALGIEPVTLKLPDDVDSEVLSNALAVSDPVKRAMLFGAQQLLAQQRGLWHLIAARHAEMSKLH